MAKYIELEAVVGMATASLFGEEKPEKNEKFEDEEVKAE